MQVISFSLGNFGRFADVPWVMKFTFGLEPSGIIAVLSLNNNTKQLAEINLPLKVSGRFVWKMKSYSLKEGKNTLQLK